MGHGKLAAVLVLAFSVTAAPLVPAADSPPAGKGIIKTTLGGRANVVPSLSNRFRGTLDRAGKLAQQDRYADAIALLHEVVTEDTLSRFELAKAQQVLSTYYQTQTDYPQAYAAIRAAIAADGLDNTEHLQAMFKAAQLLNMMDRFQESADAFEQYRREAPTVAGSDYLLQAINHFYRHDYKTALTYIDLAFATGDAPAPNWYQFKATSLLLGGDFDGAVAWCREQMQRQPGNSQWTFMLVDAYAAMEKYPEALALMDEANAKGLVSSDAQVTQRYQLYAKAGRLTDAVTVIDTALAAGQLQPDLRTLTAKGQFLYEAAQPLKGKPEAQPLLQQAIDALNQAVALDPADGNAEFWLGQIAVFAFDDNRKAREHFIAATGKKLKHPGLAWYYLGGVEDHLDHPAEARAALQKALDDPESKAVAESYLKGLK